VGVESHPSQSTRWMGHPVRPHLSRDETAAKMGPGDFPVRAMGYELCGMRMEQPAVGKGKNQYGDSGCARMTTRGGLRQNDDGGA